MSRSTANALKVIEERRKKEEERKNTNGQTPKTVVTANNANKSSAVSSGGRETSTKTELSSKNALDTIRKRREAESGAIYSSAPSSSEPNKTLSGGTILTPESEKINIPITNKKSITLNYQTAKKIDDFTKKYSNGNFGDKEAKEIDEFISGLELDEGELKNAKSYAGMKKLAYASLADGEYTFLERLAQPFVQFFVGGAEETNKIKRFIFDEGFGTNKEFSQERAKWEAHYRENPDELGDALFWDWQSNYSPQADYLRSLQTENILSVFEDASQIERFIGDAGFRSAGQMAAAMGAAGTVGLTAIGTIGSAAKNVISATKFGDKLLKISNLAPKIKAVSGTSKTTKVLNKGIDAVNSLSVGKVAKFANPFDNPTTLVMGLTSAQDKYTNLLSMGYDEDTAFKNALFTGYVNAITEKMGYNGNNANIGNFKQYLLSNASEGVEEVYANALERFGDKLYRVGYLDENGNIRQRKAFGKEGIIDPKALGENFAGGFVGGATMGAPAVVSNAVVNKHKNSKKIKGVFEKNVGTKDNFATEEDVDQYVEYAYLYATETKNKGNKAFPKQKDKIVISKADKRLVDDVNATYGIDLSNAYHELNDNDIRHIKNSHGEGSNEKYPVTIDDLKQIPDIIKNYDDVLYVERNGKKGLYYVKQHNGVTYYLEATNEKNTVLSNKQMIKVPTGTIPNIPELKDAINKKWSIDSAPNGKNVPRMYVQDVKNYTPNSNIAQGVNGVNNYSVQDSGNNTLLSAYKNKATEQQTRDANSPHSDARNASADVAFNNNILQNDNGVNKNKAVEQQTVDVQAPTSNVQNASADTTLSNNNVPQSGNSVNNHYMQNTSNNTPLAERLETQSMNNEPLSVEDVKKATGFGEEGAKLVTELANNEGVTFSQAERTVKTAYAAGFANVESSKVNFETDTQIDAFTAGKKDWVMQDLEQEMDTNQNSVDRFYDRKGSNVNSATAKIDGSSNSDLKSNAENGIINKNNISGAVDNGNVRETVERDGYISPEYETIETRKPIVATDFKADKQRRADAAEKYGLSPDEAIRLEGYVGGQMCYILNKRMINGTLVNGDSEVVDSIRNALLKMPEYAGRTYRNLKFNTEKEYNDFLSEYSEGKVVELKSFTSASKLPNGYTKFGNGVVHLVIDGVSGRDIADTFGLPRQQEVIYLPGITIEIKKVMIANDGNVLIFAEEVTPNENIRTKETGDFVNNRPETGIHQDINGYGTESVGNGANNSSVQREVQRGNGRDGVLSEWGKSADGGNVLAGKGIKKDASVTETPESEKITAGMSEETIDLTNDEDLSTRIANQRGSKKYKIIRDYILETLSEQPIILSDGILAKVDRSDALHLANRSANRKIAYISKIKDLVEQAKLYAVDTDVEHKKFDEFRYYQVNVKYGNEMYPVYLNVGHSKNSDGYHIYDITRKIGAIAKQKNALERVENDLRSEINSPISNRIISQKEKKSQEVLQSFGNDANSDKFQSTDDDKLATWTTKRVGDKVKPKSISEIVASIEHEFGINITTGHIRGNGVLGQYNKDNRGIRTKIANNLPVISHELGHYFERTLDIKSQLSNELIQELKSQLDAGFAANYTDEQIIREGVAEYVRRFLQNRETAAIDYPKFNDFFLKLLPSKDLARLQQLADDINAYYSLDADTGTSSIKLSEEGSIDLRTPMEKLKENSSSLYQALIDSNHAIKRFDRATGSNAYILASNAAYSDAIAGQIVTGDLTDKNGKYISSGLKTVLQGIDLNNKEEYRLFGEYLTVKHGPERLNKGMRVFADDRKNSTNWMQNRQAQLEKQYPRFKEVSERLYAFIKQFYKAWGVDTGLISEATLDNWSERWKYYVPFNRVLEKGKSSFGAKREFANQSSTIKKARGSGRDIKHPVDNIIENIVKMVNAGVRNDVMRTITTSAEKLGADATFLEQVPMPLSVAKMDMTGVKDNLTTWLEESDLDADSKNKANGIVSSLDDILLQYGRGKAFGNVVTVLKNGTPQAWKINDIELLQSLTSLSPKTMDGILDAYAVLSRVMTSNITSNNIVWSIFSNLPRDIGTFFTYSKNKNVVKMAKGMGEAYINKVKRDSADPLYKEFLAMGGGKTSAYTADRNLAKDVRKKLSGRRFNPNPLDWIGFVSDTIETGPRFATYKMMRDAGMTPQEAFYEAMDITVNFRRGGRISKELNKVVPFFNANVQGLDKFRRWITAEEVTGTERKRAVRNRALSFIAVSAALAAMIYAINNGDDEKEEDYEQLSTYIKNSYWVFPAGDGKHFAVPKPREIGVLSSFFETCLEYGVGENDHAFDEFYAYASENLLPAIANDIAQVGSKGLVETGMNIIGSLGMVGVIGYLGANRDFLGRPIASSGLQNLEKKDQYTDRTSKIAYWLGQAFNGSPEQIDYFFQQILGGWWKGQKALFPVGEKNRDWSLGVGSNYIKDNQYSTDLTNWLYDRADATARAKKSNPDNIDKAITAKWDSNMVDFYGTYYKKAKNDSKSTAARSTRQLVLDMIREYQKGIDGEHKTSWQEAVEKVCKVKGSTEYMPSVMSAEVTDGNDRKHNLSDIQYVEYQTDYLRLYWETVEETLSNDMTTAEKANILTAAKKVAKEQATERTLNRIGAPSSKFATKYEGVSNDTIVNFLVALDKYDEPTKTGKYGTYTQEETERAIKQLEGLSQKEKAILWQSVNTSWKASKNPFR